MSNGNKSNSIGIRSVWLEVELDVGNFPRYVKTYNSLHKTELPLRVFKDFEWMNVCVDKEYYQEQIEYKFAPQKASVEYIDWVKSFIWKRFDDGLLMDYECGLPISLVKWTPRFVGTHIHLFLEKNGAPFAKMVSVRYQVMDYLYKKLLEFFKRIAKEWVISNEYMFNELHRVTTNHNILRYFDQEYMGNRMRSNMRNYGMDYRLFADRTDKKKYQPVLWSLANENGKPFSLELRIIPNIYLMGESSEKIVELINWVEEILNNTYKSSEKEEKNWMHIASILASHNELLQMCLRYAGGNNYLNFLSREERQNIIEKIVEAYERNYTEARRQREREQVLIELSQYSSEMIRGNAINISEDLLEGLL